MPRKILVPTDFTDVSLIALKEAAAVAQECSAELIVLFADDRERREMPIYLRQKIDEVVPHTVRVEPVVVIDGPLDAILTVADEKDADWIVMGTARGSLADEVVRKCDRPVLAVHTG